MSLGSSWPLFIVLAGLSIMFPKGRGRARPQQSGSHDARRLGGFAITPRVDRRPADCRIRPALLLDNTWHGEPAICIRYWPFGLMAIGAAKLLQDRTGQDESPEACSSASAP